ncbi:MAG: PAS domain S-box protein [Pseudomonadota bacterium]|nr:PAS domain S-box protein [Pseudomonadota bacterium]
MASAVESEANYPFLAGGGELGRLIATHNWSGTALGPIDRWPVTLKTTIALILRSPLPIVTLWGEPGVMIYNDGYSQFAGHRHPSLLGMDVRSAWPEVADFNDNIIRTVFGRGETLSFQNTELTLYREGRPDTVWLNLDYSPVVDECGECLGVVAIVVETTEKILTDRQLQGERERLRQMYEQSPSFKALLEGPEHRYVMVNEAYMRLIGHRELLGLTVAEVVPEAIGQGYIELLDAAFRTGEAFASSGAKFQVQRTEHGPLEDRFVDFVYQPVSDGGGAITGIFVDGVDVTERVAAQEAIAASENQFRTFAQAMPNQVWTSPPDGQLDWFNDRVFDYSGLGADDLMGNQWARIVHTEDVGAATEAWLASLSAGTTYETEFRIRRHDGEERWHLVRALPIHGADGQIARWIGTNTDIHDQKLVEAQSVRDRDRLWALSPIVKVIVDADGTITAVNPSWTATLGWASEECVGHNILDFVVDDQRDAARERLASFASRDREVIESKSSFRAKDGEPRMFFWTTVPESGVLYAFGRDITAEVSAAQALEATEAALRQSQKMEAVGQLTGGIAHDFNNLLQGITGSLEIIQRRVAQRRFDDLDRFITGATGAANRAAALTHRLLAFSRRQPLDPRPVKVNPLLSSMEDLVRRTIGEGIKFDLVQSADVWLTRCDPNQLENAILNLVINARDAMPDGGRVTIETRNARLGDRTSGDYVLLAVSDTGIGMSPDVIARAFEPFFTTKPIGQGTGLGLSMIYGFARQSEGEVRIVSNVGEGTTIELYLPRFTGPADEENCATPTAEHHLSEEGETILVVEDDPVVRELIVELLGDLGYRTLQADDGARGIELLQSPTRIDLLVTDIGLPGLNGRQVADAGRALRPGLRILFMTGYAENAAHATGFLEPGMAMITKPFAIDVLAARVREIFEAPAIG